MMRKILLLLFIISISNFTFAKKVKFSVDMTGQTISAFGIHVVGDFQTIAGFPGGDWNSATTTLTQEVLNPNVYSIVVDIPAFAKYEYKYVNGDQFYEAEFVPVESRVGYNFNDNRWIYIDSLANDTTSVGDLQFGLNAPAGKYLLRFLVDLSTQSSVSSNGVHVASSFQNFDPSTSILYTFGSGVYENIYYVDAATYEFLYYNGNTSMDAETVPGACAVNSHRETVVSTDLVLSTVCFGSCLNCSGVGLNELSSFNNFTVSPNPSSDFINILGNINEVENMEVISSLGQQVLSLNSPQQKINIQHLATGIYTLNVFDIQMRRQSIRFVKQ